MSKGKAVGLSLVFVALAVIAGFVILNFGSLKDQLLAATYQEPAEISQIENALQLTDNGTKIFRASQPALENQAEFNEHCDSHNAEVSVLGCYTNSRIYLYRAEQSELKGVQEATAAHELLHAVWARMSGDEKNEIGAELTNYYQQHQDQFGKEMSLYDETQRLDELHSRVGTEATNLPTKLKDHYAQYFQDQEHVTSFYKTYNAQFKALKNQADQLLAEIQNLETEINKQTTEYNTRTAELQVKITEFNTCAQTADCFKSQAVFNARRQELLAEQQALEQLYNQINQETAVYNEKVTAYNNNVFHTKTLQNSINSNSQPPKV